jgi:hypothetical protein
MAETSTLAVGFKETKEALTFVFKLIDGIKAAEADKSITITDIPVFFPALLALTPAIVGANQIPLEIKAITEEEATELKTWVKENYDVSDDKLEQFIEDAFAIVLDIWIVVNRYTNGTTSDATVIAETPTPVTTGGAEAETPDSSPNEDSTVSKTVSETAK